MDRLFPRGRAVGLRGPGSTDLARPAPATVAGRRCRSGAPGRVSAGAAEAGAAVESTPVETEPNLIPSPQDPQEHPNRVSLGRGGRPDAYGPSATSLLAEGEDVGEHFTSPVGRASLLLTPERPPVTPELNVY